VPLHSIQLNPTNISPLILIVLDVLLIPPRLKTTIDQKHLDAHNAFAFLKG
jgi:hypothetical protein